MTYPFRGTTQCEPDIPGFSDIALLCRDHGGGVDVVVKCQIEVFEWAIERLREFEDGKGDGIGESNVEGQKNLDNLRATGLPCKCPPFFNENRTLYFS